MIKLFRFYLIQVNLIKINIKKLVLFLIIEDDLYLIRLLLKTGPCLKKLKRKTAVKLIRRIILIIKSNFL